MVLVLPSSNSGYITVMGNLTRIYHAVFLAFTKKIVSVPAEHVVLISFKEVTIRVIVVDVSLFRHSITFSAGRFRESRVLVWKRMRMDFTSDFMHVFQAKKISIILAGGSCIETKTKCFQLFFSFFPEDKAPQKLSNGLWNCSVDHHASFHHHVACNHQTECEDGRDESEHCPVSSPECQGLVALCNSCYKFVHNVIQKYSDDSNVIDIGTGHCNSLGGRLNFPKCMNDWFASLKTLTKMHVLRLRKHWVGFYGNDVSLPIMYRHEILDMRSVLHHMFDVTDKLRMFQFDIVHHGLQKCYSTGNFQSRPGLLANEDCRNRDKFIHGIVCEFTLNQTEKHSYQPNPISLTATYSFVSGRSVIKCLNGQLTHSFLVCGSNQYKVCGEEPTQCSVSDQMPHVNGSYSQNHRDIMSPQFTCSDGAITLPFTLVCDFIQDCVDKTDESVCQYPACANTFQCTNGQCLSFHKMCDQTSHCHDDSDETNCEAFLQVRVRYVYVPSPALVNFDGIRKFTSAPMNSTETCPDSHYRCPGDFNDCLPVYTRCNGMYDCTDYKDEEGCEDLTCTGFFRCRASAICVHVDQLCDGWPHCPMNDDESVCYVTCPAGCLCQGHTFLCSQPFPTALFPHLRYLDATGSGMTLSDVDDHAWILHLILAKCSLALLPEVNAMNLRVLDLSENEFLRINITCFLSLTNLQALFLSNNPIILLYTDPTSDLRQHTLTALDLSLTFLTVLETEVFSAFPRLQQLSFNFTPIHTISPSGFQFTQQLTELYMDGSPVKNFPLDIFREISDLRVIVAQNFKFCCKEVLPSYFDESSCHSPPNEISSCEDLLQSWTYRGFLWAISCLSLTGNIFCLCARLVSRSMTSSSGFSVFVINLTVADFLMGAYIAVIGAADELFRGTYLHYEESWRGSATCKMAGFLSLFSSEVSALIIWLITLDRFIVLHFPFSSCRFEKTSAAVACLVAWVIGSFLALVPVLPVTSHWEFYGQTGICIPLPVTRHEFKGKLYSFSVFIGFNFILFLFISAGQALIYWSIRTNALKANTTKTSKDMTIAQRLITVAVTDFMCWFPIGISGILASTGTSIPGEVNVTLAIFVLPLNSAVNPFMYTFNTLAEKRRISNEAKLSKWLESYANLIKT